LRGDAHAHRGAIDQAWCRFFLLVEIEPLHAGIAGIDRVEAANVIGIVDPDLLCADSPAKSVAGRCYDIFLCALGSSRARKQQQARSSQRRQWSRKMWFQGTQK